MEKLLEKAFKEASDLPEEEKEAFAAFILEELRQEKRWEELYKKSPEKLQQLANEALKEYRQGNTEMLDPDNL